VMEAGSALGRGAGGTFGDMGLLGEAGPGSAFPGSVGWGRRWG
jgi:hypothetical protein